MKLVTHLILLSFPLGLLMGCAAPEEDRSVGQITEAVAIVIFVKTVGYAIDIGI